MIRSAMLKLTAKLVLAMVATLALVAIASCASRRELRMNSSITMMALNSVQPFVSKSFAQRMALLIIEDRYPPDVFLPKGPGTVVDDGEVWRVTFDNDLVDENNHQENVMVGGAIVPRKLVFVIRKSNAEVMDIQ